MTRRQARGTATSTFGVGGRESHDASRFYARFQPKVLSADEELADPFVLERPLVCGDARAMDLPDNSVGGSPSTSPTSDASPTVRSLRM